MTWHNGSLDVAGISQRLMLVAVGFTLPGQSKLDKQATQEVLTNHQAAQEAGAFNGKIWPKEALAEVKSLQGGCQRWIASQTFPFPAEATYILPAGRYVDFTKGLGVWLAKRDKAIDATVCRLSEWVALARVIRQGLFKAEEYPPNEDCFRQLFDRRVDYLPFPCKTTFGVLEVCQDALNELAEGAEKKAGDIIRQSMRELWRRLAEPLAKMVQTLEGESKGWHSTLLGNVVQALETIPGLNIAGDPDLEAIRVEVKGLVAGLTVQGLKQDPALRTATAKQVDSIVQRMKGFMS